MADLLYAEVYLICLIIVSLILYWSLRSGARSTPEVKLRNVLIAFLANFTSNFCFTLFNGVRIIPSAALPASYVFKTAYHLSLCAGVFLWCDYAQTERETVVVNEGAPKRSVVWLMVFPAALAVSNFWTHWLFEIEPETLAYRRNFMFQYEMLFLLIVSATFSARLAMPYKRESDPSRKSHLMLTASFQLCILAAWILSLTGEAVPVICVSIMVELLCLYMGTTIHQVSVDRLTQVNNRQNLLGYMEFKIKNHDLPLHLLMIDVDHFKPINDTYGHLEGDKALVRVAKALKYACIPQKKRPYIARYGGDEFIVIVEAFRKDADALADAIRDELRQRNENAGAPYELTVSIGIAACAPDATPKSFIADADAALYEIKAKR